MARVGRCLEEAARNDNVDSGGPDQTTTAPSSTRTRRRAIRPIIRNSCSHCMGASLPATEICRFSEREPCIHDLILGPHSDAAV
jgi:hypothetical protein